MNKGFTLVELMIVMAIISILLAIIVPEYQKYTENHQESQKVFISPIGLNKSVPVEQEHEQKPSVHML